MIEAVLNHIALQLQKSMEKIIQGQKELWADLIKILQFQKITGKNKVIIRNQF